MDQDDALDQALTWEIERLKAENDKLYKLRGAAEDECERLRREHDELYDEIAKAVSRERERWARVAADWLAKNWARTWSVEEATKSIAAAIREGE